jgi:uncharacterized membrane protein
MEPTTQGVQFNPAEIGALAHLYRGEMYRSKIWRSRLDGTTNWAVGTTGIGLSVTFSNPANSPLTLILVGLLVLIFLLIEARRYRYFDIWRTRVRLLEVCFFGPILKGEGVRTENGWNEALARDYEHLRFHISFLEAFGRRLQRNYGWIFVVLGVSFITKIIVHPLPLQTWAQFWERTAIGPLSGKVTIFIGFLSYLILFLMGLMALNKQRAAGRVIGPQDQDPIMKVGRV